MQISEKLGQFYLGKPYDIAARQVLPGEIDYDAKDLTTHAVCVGMTGSGKTGLCLTLLEEAAIDGIPAIVIDPKGDLSNLLLTFPELKPSDFRPWIDLSEAGRRGITPDELAEQTAAEWRAGLAEWGQDGDRIARFRDAAEPAIYTPGSFAGLRLSVLRSFGPPAQAILDDGDALRERIGAAVSGLLALLGIDADPLRSREHILLSNLVERAWRDQRNLDLGALIRDIQSPPFDKIGVLDLESVFPAKARYGLATSLNNLLASPGFSAWMEGDPLDIQRLLYTAKGKPRLSIISIAHLSEAERMFFVTILLNEVVAWMRSQTGSTSLRALLYMDEVFGYFPPTANPPAKKPMLTLLKQARAYGLGIVLATQNPVDLDYKGLSNAGTWFIGRLQTERDKARVLDGLEGASSAAGAAFDRQKMDQIISGLGKRVFLMNNVHEDHPVVFQSRWALSFLRGPLSREQIQTLMADRQPEAKPAATTPPASAAAVAPARQPAATPSAAVDASQRPILPPEIPEFFVPLRKNVPAGATLVYRPAIFGTARVHFAQAKSNIDVWETLALSAFLGETLPPAPWDDAELKQVEEVEFDKTSATGECRFEQLPAELTRPKTFTTLASALKDHLYRTHALDLWKCAALKQTSQAGESEGDFRVRLSQAARELRDATVEKLRSKYAPKLALLEDRRRRAQQKVEKEKTEASEQTWQSFFSIISSALSALMGRKFASAANVNRAASAARAAGRIGRENQDVTAAEENVKQFQDQYAELEAELQAKIAKRVDSVSAEKLALEEVVIKPKKADIGVTQVALVWMPHGVAAEGTEARLF